MPEGSKIIKGKKVEVPIWEKTTLTIEEAVAYSGIGQHKLRELTRQPECLFVLWIGTHRLIKRKEFDEFLEMADTI